MAWPAMEPGGCLGLDGIVRQSGIPRGKPTTGRPAIDTAASLPIYSLAQGAAMEAKQHWDTVYSTKVDDQVSWFQTSPASSLSMIGHPPLGARIIDIGGGALVCIP